MGNNIVTVKDLYNSLSDNVAYNYLGKFYFKWKPETVPVEEMHLCRDINEVLEELGYKLVDSSIAGEYNDIRGYWGCRIKEI